MEDTNKSNLVFKDIKVLLINLDRAEKRYEQMVAQFKEKEIEFEKISAVDGKNYQYTNKEFNKRLFMMCEGKKENPAEIGCYLSHYFAIERFLKTDKKFCIIFEDDAIINDDFKDIVKELADNSNSWDFVKFNTSRDSGFGNIKVMSLLNDKYKMVASLFPKHLSAAYIINRKAAESFYKKLLPMFSTYDHEFVKFWKYNMKQYSIFPSPITVPWNDSFIYSAECKKFPFYKRATVLFYRMLTQLSRTIFFYKLFKK